MYETYIKHHGILGQKWGIRRYQPYPSGERVKGGKEVGAATKVQQREDNTNAKIDKQNKQHESKIDKQKKQHESKIDKKSETSEKKGLITKHRENLINGYLEKGYSKEAAELAAKNRMRTEVILGVAGAVVLTSATIYASRKIGQNYCDKVFKAGSTIQNIGATKDIQGPFFAAVNKHDKRAYGNLYPAEKKRMQQWFNGVKNPEIYKHQIGLQKDIKRASIKNAREIFANKFNSDEKFRQGVLDTLKKTNYNLSFDGSKIKPDDTKKIKVLYDRFNQSLATKPMQDSGLHKQFYDELQKKGYNAILDINDTKYSGYKNIAHAPTIFFGDGKFKQIADTKLSDTQIDNNAIKYATEIMAKNLAKYTAAYAGYTSVATNTAVNNYIKKHPNTTLTRKEIIEKLKKDDKS